MLQAIIREHLEPFFRVTSDRGDESGLPRFVEQELGEFFTCGVLAHGFTRLRCADCTFEGLLPFSASAKASVRAGGLRMAEHAASLVDEVVPRVPVCQWVLTLPYRLRYRLAWDHALCRAVPGAYVRTLLAFYAGTARLHGIQDGRTGTLTAIQRFGSGLQLNIPFHTLVLDGVISPLFPIRASLQTHLALPNHS